MDLRMHSPTLFMLAWSVQEVRYRAGEGVALLSLQCATSHAKRACEVDRADQRRGMEILGCAGSNGSTDAQGCSADVAQGAVAAIAGYSA